MTNPINSYEGDFSTSLIIHLVKTKEIRTVTVACEQAPPKKTESEASREGPRETPSLPAFFPSSTPSFFLPRSFRPILDRRACSQATVTVVWISDLNKHRFLGFYFSVYSLVLVSFEKLIKTLEKVFHRLSKHIEFRQKYSAARHIFNSLLGVGNPDETPSLVFDILLPPPNRMSP